MSLARINDVVPTQEEPEIRQHLGVVRRRLGTLCGTFILVLGLGTAATFMLKPVYQASAKLVVPAVTGPKAGRADTQAAITEIEIAAAPKSLSLAAQADEMMGEAFLSVARARAEIAERRRASVKVEAPDHPTSDVLTVTVAGPDAAEAARLANSVAQLQVERSEKLQREGLERAIRFMRRERDAAARKLAQAESALERFQGAYPVRQLQLQQENGARQLSDLRTRVTQARSSISSLEAQLDSYRARLHKEAPDVPKRVTKDNPQRLLLQDKLRQLKIQRVELLRDFQPTSPEVEALDDQIRGHEEQLASEPAAVTEVTYGPNPRHQMLEARVAELEAGLLSSRETYRAELEALRQQSIPRDFSGAEARQATLTQNLNRAFERYHTLSDRLQALELRQSAQTSNARVILAATPPKSPSSPFRPLLIVLAAVLAGIVALGAVFLQDFLDDRVSQPADLERSTLLPTLGCVPQISGSMPLLDSGMGDAKAIESYRAVRSSIGFAALDRDLRRLQVTSAGPDEGKSTTAVNLAIAMSWDGKRVILVDADLRSPSLHTLLGVKRSPGLSEVLSGDHRVDLALQSTDTPNLRLLSAGEPVENATELLNSPNFRFVLEHLERSADCIILDTSPCNVADPLVVSSRMDGVVLVVRVGRTRRGTVRQAIEMLRRARARLVGTVYNGARFHGGTDLYAAWGPHPGVEDFAGWEPERREPDPRSCRGSGYRSRAEDGYPPEWLEEDVPEDWFERPSRPENGRNGRSHANGVAGARRMLKPGRVVEFPDTDDEDRIA